MTAFHTIAVPHEDILTGRLTMDVFAADLWEVYKERAPDEYRDPTRFFQKTYQTEGLSHLLDVVAKRLRGEGYNTRLLARSGARMTGVDISERMIELARREEHQKGMVWGSEGD